MEYNLTDGWPIFDQKGVSMPRSRAPEDLSVEELRRLLIEKSRAQRDARLESFRRTGRIVPVEPRFEAEEVLPPPDDLDVVPIHPRRRKRTVMDGLLLLVEVAAVAGLLFIMFRVLGVLVDLNQEVAASLQQPTLTPTAIYKAVVLPSGHTSPVLSKEVSFNKAEIPEHLLPLVQSMDNLPLPTPGPQQAVRIRIPRINVDAPVVQGDGFEQLKKGVGQHLDTANPGEKGNLVLSAHNDVFGEIFRYLDELKEGDEIHVYTSQREYIYIISEIRIVEPTTVEVMDQTVEPMVTLISCYPYHVDKQRIVVRAYLQGQP